MLGLFFRARLGGLRKRSWRLNRLLRLLTLALALSGVTVALEAVLDATPTAQAQSVPEGLNRLEQKLNDVQALIRRVLYVFVGIGIAFCGFRFVQGDPHAWKFTMMVVVGATIVFASGEILTWLER